MERCSRIKFQYRYKGVHPKQWITLLNHWVIKNSPHVRESFCLLNPESGNILLVESGILGLRIPKIQLKESGIPITIGIRNPESKFPLTKAGIQYPESGIYHMESRIQDALGFHYVRWKNVDLLRHKHSINRVSTAYIAVPKVLKFCTQFLEN